MKNLCIIASLAFSLTSYGQVILNEMQSSNTSTLADDWGEFEDWIEIYNPTANPIEIGGLILKDQLDTWAIPTGDPSTLIPPNGYFLLWADDQEVQGIFHTNFKLAAGGEFLGLYESDGTTVIDSVTIPGLFPNQSYIHCDTVWMESTAPTPLEFNGCEVGIDENTFPDDISIAITDSQLTIEIANYSNEVPNLCISSLDGKKRIENSINEKKTVLNIETLESGVYIITISTLNSVYSRKVWL